MDLPSSHCTPCKGGEPALTAAQLDEFLLQLSNGWKVVGGKRLERTFTFDTFPQAIAFVDRVAALAQAEGHHPDIHIHYTRVTLELWTHAVAGLSPNDLILASKIDHGDRCKTRDLAAYGNPATASL